MDERFSRTIKLIGEQGYEKLRNASVLVVGVGGVGGYAVEMLARCGVGRLTLVDGDRVDITNINRQIIALSDTVGSYKTDAFAKRLTLINPDIELNLYNIRYNEETSQEILRDSYDYIVDAIDSLKDKIHLIQSAKELNVPIISAMGAGNRAEFGDFEIVDIYNTSGDRLAKKLRKELKNRGVKSLDCVFTDIIPQKSEDYIVGSIAYMPAMAGIKLASYVIDRLLSDGR